jgi:ATPase subunit of ABC transporter with duplicated ATPase domains
LVQGLSITVNKGDKIAFVGAEHQMKSLFFDAITDSLPATCYLLLATSVNWGQTTKFSYNPKENSEFFKSDMTITEWLKQYSPQQDDTYVRGFLGRMLFSGDEALKPVNVLSGGEKVRCMLARMMLSGANVLILDEPTNHLDLEAITALNDGLVAFPGVVLFNSHDHEFINSIANRIVEFTPATDGKGNAQYIDRQMPFDDYLDDQGVKDRRAELYHHAERLMI